MTLRDDLNALTPRLRRYARALASGHPGGCEQADDLVHATLMRALGSRQLGTRADLVIRVYATLTQMHREVAVASEGTASRPSNLASHGGIQARVQPASMVVRQSKVTAGLMNMPLEEREALLLVALESFDHSEASRILRISRTALLTRLTRARVDLAAYLKARSGPPPRAVGDERERHGTHLRLVK